MLINLKESLNAINFKSMQTMKIYIIIAISSIIMLMASCMKDKSGTDYSVIDGEKSKTLNALELSQAFNDTLKMVYDTAKIHKGNLYCIKYDKLYHQGDSMFKVHYSLFGDEMYKNGLMMQNYSPSNSMIQGGMMNSGSMDMNRMMGDTAIVEGYYRNMHQLRNAHQPYHNGIFN
jgi:hypothetical protein